MLKPLCRKQSKAVSQRRWLQKPENENTSAGRKIASVSLSGEAAILVTGARKLAAKRPLQDLCSKQVAHNEEVTDLLLREPALIVGLISTMTQKPFLKQCCAQSRNISRTSTLDPSPIIYQLALSHASAVLRPISFRCSMHVHDFDSRDGRTGKKVTLRPVKGHKRRNF